MSNPEPEVNVDVDVDVPQPEPEPEPEPTPEPVPVPVPVPSNDAYQAEHNARHETLDERFRVIEEKLEEHSGLHRNHEESHSFLSQRVGEIEGKLVEPTEPEPTPEPETEPEPIIDEPTIIPPDVPNTEVTRESQHWLRRIGF